MSYGHVSPAYWNVWGDAPLAISRKDPGTLPLGEEIQAVCRDGGRLDLFKNGDHVQSIGLVLGRTTEEQSQCTPHHLVEPVEVEEVQRHVAYAKGPQEVRTEPRILGYQLFLRIHPEEARNDHAKDVPAKEKDRHHQQAVHGVKGGPFFADRLEDPSYVHKGRAELPQKEAGTIKVQGALVAAQEEHGETSQCMRQVSSLPGIEVHEAREQIVHEIPA
eukprot:scaffold285_cov330-Pavlova_lutheri.AAC.38